MDIDLEIKLMNNELTHREITLHQIARAAEHLASVLLNAEALNAGDFVSLALGPARKDLRKAIQQLKEKA